MLLSVVRECISKWDLCFILCVICVSAIWDVYGMVVFCIGFC